MATKQSLKIGGWMNEAYCLATLQEESSKHSVKLYEIMMDAHCVYLVLEYCEAGSLLDQMVVCQNGDKEKIFGRSCFYKNFGTFATQSYKSLAWMFDQNVIHGNINPGNILLRINANGGKRAIFAGFGLSNILAKDENEDGNSSQRRFLFPKVGYPRFGTPRYFTPKPTSDDDLYSRDVWALGVTFYNLFTGGSFPFKVDPSTQLPVISSAFEKNITKALRMDDDRKWHIIVRKILSLDPNDRLSWFLIQSNFSIAKNPKKGRRSK